MAIKIYDGSRDKTNYFSDKFLETNSAGTQLTPKGVATVRRGGRVDYHILIVIKGSYLVMHGDDMQKLCEGGFVLYYPNEPHGYEAMENSLSYWIHFSGTAAAELLSTANLPSGIYEKCSPSALEKCAALLSYTANESTKMLSISTLIELIHELSLSAKNEKAKKIPEAVLAAVAYINMNYARNITIDELSSVSGYSKSRFSHLFSETMRTTPIKYQNKLRLESARSALLAADLSVGEIASLCGFEDQLYFSRVFRKEFGVPPSEYKNTLINAEKNISKDGDEM